MSTALHKGKIYLEAAGKANTGQWVFVGSVEVLDKSIADNELGKSILNVLNRSREGVPLPTSFDGPGNMAIAAGCKTWPQFARDAKSVSLEWVENQGTEFLPSRWEGPRKGGTLLEEKAFVVNDHSPAKLAAALRQAFDLCE